MLVTLLAVGAFVALRSLSRPDPAVGPVAVDFRQAAEYAHREGFAVVYPAPVPRDWTVTSVHLDLAGSAWGMGMLTGEGTFAGVRQEPGPLAEMLEVYVDERVDEGAPLTLDQAGTGSRPGGPVASRWRTFTDEGGDTAYAADFGRRVVLVYGSADDEALRRLLAALTDVRP